MRYSKFILILCFISLGCKNQKEFQFVQSYIESDNTNLSKVFLSIENFNYNHILNSYTERKEFLETNNSKTNSYKWLFTKEELKQMQDFYSEKTMKPWGDKQLSFLKRIKLDTLKGKSMYTFFQTNKNKVVSVSKPLYNIDKNKCMFFYSFTNGPTGDSQNYLVTFLKENKVWKEVGKIYSGNLH